MNKKIIIGVNGSDDSLTAAYLLIKQKYEVSAIGVFFGHIEDTEESNYPEVYQNYKVKDISKIQEKCKKLNIPFQVIDAREQYKAEIIDPLISSRLEGIQFDISLEMTRLLIKVLFEKMIELRGDLIATGHFAKVVHSAAQNQFFIKSTDPIEEDQSHLLCRVSNFHMTKLHLPFADMRKTEVRKIFSQNFTTITQEKALTKNTTLGMDLTPYIPSMMIKRIDIISYTDNNTIATVNGIQHIELGQNKIQDEEKNTLFSDRNSTVAKIEPEKNRAYVIKTKELAFDACLLSKFSTSSSTNQSKPINVFAKFKNSKTRYPAFLIFRNNGHALIHFKELLEIQALIGHTVVFYDDIKSKSSVLGSGEIKNKGIFQGNQIKEFPNQTFDNNNEEYNENSSFLF